MGTSLCKKEKTTIRNKKIIKEKTHWKRQMQKKAADHTLIKQVERLKDKSSKSCISTIGR